MSSTTPSDSRRGWRRSPTFAVVPHRVLLTFAHAVSADWIPVQKDVLITGRQPLPCDVKADQGGTTLMGHLLLMYPEQEAVRPALLCERCVRGPVSGTSRRRGLSVTLSR